MKNARKITTVLFCLLLIFSLCACGEESAPESTPAVKIQEVSIWCLAGDPLTPGLKDRAEEFNAEQSEYLASVTEFASEEALAEAFAGSSPDLLLCNLFTADAMLGRGDSYAADDSASLPRYSEALTAASPCVGRSYFPIAASTQVLLISSAVYDGTTAETFASLDGLCSLAAAYGADTGKPFLAAEDFSTLFETFLRQRNTGLSGEREIDVLSEDYKIVYNLLAECAFNGGLSMQKDELIARVTGGELPCAAVSTDEIEPSVLASADMASLPVVSGGERVFPAQLGGLAVTVEEGGAGKFIEWLFSASRASRLALDGLSIPVYGTGSPENELESFLCSAAQWDFFYSMEASDAGFDADFRQAMELLG